MKLVNPKYVLRNWMAQLAIDAAEEEDYSVANELFELLKNPYDEQPEFESDWFQKDPNGQGIEWVARCFHAPAKGTLASETKKRRATRSRSPRCSAVVCLLTNQRRSRSMRMGPSPSHSG